MKFAVTLIAQRILYFLFKMKRSIGSLQSFSTDSYWRDIQKLNLFSFENKVSK